MNSAKPGSGSESFIGDGGVARFRNDAEISQETLATGVHQGVDPSGNKGCMKQKAHAGPGL